MDEYFMCMVLDESVDYIRFLGEDLVQITYTDGSLAYLERHSGGWHNSGGPPPGDAATAAGMYDHD